MLSNDIYPKHLITAILLAAIGLLFPVTASAAQDLPRSVLIIDGSGSMWGRIGTREKIVIARELLADRLTALKDKLSLGVMSYGHRRRRDCRDIEMIVPITPIKPETHARAIKRLLPRGKTPVASALLKASEALYAAKTSGSRKKHIIFVADGSENCRMNPCKTAADLAKQHKDLVIDVIGFGIKDKDVDQLNCISEATGGAFFRARNRGDLAKAIDTAFSRQTNRTKAAKTAAQPQKIAPPGLYLSASLGPGTAKNRDDWLKNDLTWRIYKAGDSTSKGSTPLKRATKANPVLKLASATYHVEARHGPLTSEKDIVVDATKPVRLHLAFNAAILSADARLGRQSKTAVEAIFSLYDTRQGTPGPRNVMSHKQGKQAVFYLSPGKYALKVRSGEIVKLYEFTPKAGDRHQINMFLEAGRLFLEARLTDTGPPLEDVQYTLYREGEAGASQFLKTLDPQPQITLPAGRYVVLAHHGRATRHARIHLKEGEKQKLILTLNAGRLKVSSRLSDKNSNGAPITYSIEAIAPSLPKTLKLTPQGLREISQPLPNRSFSNVFMLPQGDYLVRALYGNSNAEATARVHVTAGQERELAIPVSAGRIRPSLVVKPGTPPLPSVFWSVFDKAGQQIASASSGTPSMTLAKGKYRLVADYLGYSYKREVDLAAGDDKKVELVINQ